MSGPVCRHLARYAGVLGCPECCADASAAALAEHMADGRHMGEHLARTRTAEDVASWRGVFEHKLSRAPNVYARAYALGALAVIGGPV